MRLKRFLEEDGPPQKTDNFPWFFVTPTQAKIPQPKAINYNYLRSLARSPIPRRGINVIKNQVASMPWHISVREGVRDKRKHEKEIANWTRWLRKPNSTETWMKFIMRVVEDIMVLDAGVFEPTFANGRAWMYSVDGSTVYFVSGWDGSGPRYYQMVPRPTGDPYGIPLENEDITYIMANPSTFWPYGLSPLEIAAREIEYLLGARDYAGNTANKANPKKMLDLGRSSDSDHVNQFRAYWASEVAGRGVTPIVGGTDRVGVVDVGAKDDQGLYLLWQQFLIRIIANAFNLPPVKFGLTADVNRSTAESGDQASDEEAVRPIAELIRDAINDFIWSCGYTDIELRYRYDMSPQQIQARALALRNETESEIRSIDEGRAELGLPPHEDEEMGKATLYEYRKLVDKKHPTPKTEPPESKEAPPLNKKSSGAGQEKELPEGSE